MNQYGNFDVGDVVVVKPNVLSYSGSVAVVVRSGSGSCDIRITKLSDVDSYLFVGSVVNLSNWFLELDKNQIVINILNDL